MFHGEGTRDVDVVVARSVERVGDEGGSWRVSSVQNHVSYSKQRALAANERPVACRRHYVDSAAFEAATPTLFSPVNSRSVMAKRRLCCRFFFQTE